MSADLGKIGEAYVAIRASLDAFHADLEKASPDLEKSLKKVGENLKSAGQTLTYAVTLPIVGLGVAMVKAASDAEETSSKFNAVFKENAEEVRKWADAQAEATNRGKTELEGFLASVQDTFVPLGLSRDKAAELSKSVVALAVDMASFNNAADSDVVASLTSALVGNHDAVRKFGVVINEATLEAQLFKDGVKGGTKEATEQQKALARLNIILKSTSDAQGDAKRTAESFANQWKGLLAASHDLAVEFGQIMIPTVLELVKEVKEAITWFRNLDSDTKTLIVEMGLFAAALGPVLIVIGQLSIGIGALVPLFGKMAEGVKAAAASFSTWGPIAASVAAVGFVVLDTHDKISNFQVSNQSLSDQLKEQPTLWENVKNALNPIGGAIDSVERSTGLAKAAWKEYGDTIKEWIGLQPGVGGAIDTNAPKFTGYADAMADAHAEMQTLTDKTRADIAAAQERGDVVGVITGIENTAKTAVAEHATAIKSLTDSFVAQMQPANDLETDIKALLDNGFSKHEIVKTWKDKILDVSAAHVALNGEDALPKTVKELRDMAVAAESATGAMLLLPPLNPDFLDKNKQLAEIYEAVNQQAKDLGPNFSASTISIIQGIGSFGESTSTLEEVEAAFDRVTSEAIETGKATDANAEAAKRWQDAWAQAVADIGTKFSRGVSDWIFEGKSFAESMIGIFKDLGKSLVEIMTLQLFAPLLQGFSGVMQSLSGALWGALGVGGASVGSALGGVAANAGGSALSGALGGGAAGGGGLLGGLFGGGGGAAAAGGGAAAAAGTGAAAAGGTGAGLMGSLGAFFTNPWTIGIGAALAGGLALWKIFGSSPEEEGAGEAARDFGVNVSSKTMEQFIRDLGITAAQFEGIRKDITSSPAFFQQVLLPQAQMSGQVEALIASFSKLQVSAAVGKNALAAGVEGQSINGGKDILFDLSDAVRKAIETGDYSEFNRQFELIFKNSNALTAALPNFASVLAGPVLNSLNSASDAAQNLANTAGAVAEGINTPGQVASGQDIHFHFDITTLDGEGLEELTRERIIPIIEQEIELRNVDFGGSTANGGDYGTSRAGGGG